MTYSSEGSPTSAGGRSRGSRRHPVKEDDRGEVPRTIPCTMLAWLNDNSGSSDTDAATGRGLASDEQTGEKGKAAVVAMGGSEGKRRLSGHQTVEIAAKAAARAAAAAASKATVFASDAGGGDKSKCVPSLTAEVPAGSAGEKATLLRPSGSKVDATAAQARCPQGVNESIIESGQSSDSHAYSSPVKTARETATKTSLEEEVQRWLSGSEEGFDGSRETDETVGSRRGDGGEDEDECHGLHDAVEGGRKDCSSWGEMR